MAAGPALAYTDMDEVAEDYGRWMIHGPQGSGKTTLASTIAELGPTLFIEENQDR
jgi:ABC-type molybdenum transport system ATPase subunit/photorepair protein PhrA